MRSVVEPERVHPPQPLLQQQVLKPLASQREKTRRDVRGDLGGLEIRATAAPCRSPSPAHGGPLERAFALLSFPGCVEPSRDEHLDRRPAMRDDRSRAACPTRGPSRRNVGEEGVSLGAGSIVRSESDVHRRRATRKQRTRLVVGSWASSTSGYAPRLDTPPADPGLGVAAAARSRRCAKVQRRTRGDPGVRGAEAQWMSSRRTSDDFVPGEDLKHSPSSQKTCVTPPRRATTCRVVHEGARARRMRWSAVLTKCASAAASMPRGLAPASTKSH